MQVFLANVPAGDQQLLQDMLAAVAQAQMTKGSVQPGEVRVEMAIDKHVKGSSCIHSGDFC
jgi:hypothetical protein